MLLVIDVGNTNTSLGVYRDDVLLAHWRLTTSPSRTVDEYGVHARNLFELAHMDVKDIEAIAVASVVPPLNYTVRRMAEVYFNLTPLFIDHTTDTGLKILYERRRGFHFHPTVLAAIFNRIGARRQGFVG